jgi:hypothetical protein
MIIGPAGCAYRLTPLLDRTKVPNAAPPARRNDRAGGEAISVYGVGSASAPPLMSLLPKVAGQEASTFGAASGVAVYSEAR